MLDESSLLETFQALDPQAYLSKFVKQHTREDGRPLHQSRVTSVVSSVLIRNTVGSAMVRLGDTKVVAGVTVQVGNPCASRPNCGEVSLSLHTSPLCGKTFGVRSTNNNNNNNSSTIQDVQATESYLNRILQSCDVIDLDDLCIEPAKTAWKLGIHVEVLNHDGNLIDAAFLAAVAALANVQLPSILPTDNNDKNNNNNNSSQVQIIAVPHSSNEQKDKSSFLKLQSIPIPLSIGVFYSNNNNNDDDDDDETCFLLVDPNSMEEQACHGMVHVVVDSQTQQIYSCQTIGGSSHHNGPQNNNGNNYYSSERLAACIQIAFGRAQEMTPLIQSCNNNNTSLA
eukprot:CAMPEP_0197828722 /NCGR_PEP_ID=MMETSP1437-20131217/5251_1 /TAXON_ID=49252 ORGANISM="Eucampia antarctica, Strain CCMP1452" /NCGR_SAMPLE_ID=MMETSP1437 /ASSEMBLY_ACC=CAM_ASM_001096 /LENGTH=339 /DNA_ID=CAMNT_0043430057 /DNA_START=26 /DNA_END=1045 /DNA_ORIENTATION=-